MPTQVWPVLRPELTGDNGFSLLIVKDAGTEPPVVAPTAESMLSVPAGFPGGYVQVLSLMQVGGFKKLGTRDAYIIHVKFQGPPPVIPATDGGVGTVTVTVDGTPIQIDVGYGDPPTGIGWGTLWKLLAWWWKSLWRR